MQLSIVIKGVHVEDLWKEYIKKHKKLMKKREKLTRQNESLSRRLKGNYKNKAKYKSQIESIQQEIALIDIAHREIKQEMNKRVEKAISLVPEDKVKSWAHDVQLAVSGENTRIIHFYMGGKRVPSGEGHGHYVLKVRHGYHCDEGKETSIIYAKNIEDNFYRPPRQK